MVENIKNVKSFLSYLDKNKIEYKYIRNSNYCIPDTIEFDINKIPCKATIGGKKITLWSYTYYDKISDKNKQCYVSSLSYLYIHTDKLLYDKWIKEQEEKLNDIINNKIKKVIEQLY